MSAGPWNALLSEVQEPLAEALGARRQAIRNRSTPAWRETAGAAGASAPRELEAMSALFLPTYLTRGTSRQVRCVLLSPWSATVTPWPCAACRRAKPSAACSPSSRPRFPYVVDRGAGELAAALLRLTFAGSLALTAGYSTRADHELAELRRAGAASPLARSPRRDRPSPRRPEALPRNDRDGDLQGAPGADPREARGGHGASSARPSSRCAASSSTSAPSRWRESASLPALKLYARQFSARTGVKVRVRDTRAATAAARRRTRRRSTGSCRARLSNVLKHAQARTVKVTVRQSERLRDRDDASRTTASGSTRRRPARRSAWPRCASRVTQPRGPAARGLATGALVAGGTARASRSSCPCANERPP